MNVFVARLCSERDGLRAQVGVGVGGKQESQGAATEHDKGVTPVLKQKRFNRKDLGREVFPNIFIHLNYSSIFRWHNVTICTPYEEK